MPSRIAKPLTPTDRGPRRERGTVTIMVVLGMITLLAFAALAIDTGHVLVTKNQLQNAADAGALAAAAELGDVYTTIPGGSYGGYSITSGDHARLFTAADSVTRQQQAAGVAIAVDAADFHVGRWDFAGSAMSVGPLAPTSVQVTARRSASVNSPIRTFLGHIVGVDEMSVSAVSVAALTPLGSVGTNEITIPVGLSEAWFSSAPNTCNQPIKLYPTGDLSGCAGWHTYFDGPANASRLSQVLQGLEDGSYPVPAADVGDVLNFTGGTVASAFDDMKALFETRRLDEPPFTEWETTVAVYHWPDCSNPSGPIDISGFATLVVTGVMESPTKTIQAVVQCDMIVDGSGGGGTFGTLASRPVLVD